MLLTRRCRVGFSYVEVSIVLTIISFLAIFVWTGIRSIVPIAMDTRVKANLSIVRSAATCYALDHNGRSPRSEREVSGYVSGRAAGGDLSWTGSGGSGRIVYGPKTGAILVDGAGRVPAGFDSSGRRYADYR